ncbi:MAG: hypothetical protein A2Z25_04755 [Planctomycetes bacterium RBG_16_55_9]|nr:MAG: hypothetical protein A2Z25_04755 [Planctomycetes bacterium RBG_16_55_9]
MFLLSGEILHPRITSKIVKGKTIRITSFLQLIGVVAKVVGNLLIPEYLRDGIGIQFPNKPLRFSLCMLPAVPRFAGGTPATRMEGFDYLLLALMR